MQYAIGPSGGGNEPSHPHVHIWNVKKNRGRPGLARPFAIVIGWGGVWRKACSSKDLSALAIL